MTQEQQPYTGTHFLEDLDRSFGGSLYFTVDSHFKEANLRPNLTLALNSFPEAVVAQGIHPPEIKTTSDPAIDFKGIIIQAVPHPAEAGERVHLLADPYCRSFLQLNLCGFVNACFGLNERAETDENFPLLVEDNLPFANSIWNSFIFKSILALPDLNAYLERAKTKSQELVQIVELEKLEKPRFVEELHKSIERIREYIKLGTGKRLADIHPFIRQATPLLHAQYMALQESMGLIC